MDPGPANRGLKKLVSMLFRRKMSKNVAYSDMSWSGELSSSQQKLAATRVFAAFLVLMSFRNQSGASVWKAVGMEPNPILAARIKDDTRISKIRGW